MQGNPRRGNDPDLRRVGIHPDFWYPVARSKDLSRGKTLGVTFAGDPIALVRSATGRVFALEDRCAHRQVPLHLGVVDGERLQCCYHSWCYDESGKVVGIPYLPKGQGVSMGVRSYPCREAYRLIFVFPGDPEKAGQVAFPDIPTWSSPYHKTMYFSRRIKCHYSLMHENLMDMNHQFLHRRLMGSIRAELLDAQKGRNWIEASYRFVRVSGRRHWGAGLMLWERDPHPRERDFDIMTIRTEYPYQTLTVRRPSGEPAFHLWTAYVPADKDQRVNHSFGLLMIKKPKFPGLIRLFWPGIRLFTERVFAEDRMVVEAEQQAHDLQGADWNQEVHPLILDLRAILIRNGIPLADQANSAKDLQAVRVCIRE